MRDKNAGDNGFVTDVVAHFMLSKKRYRLWLWLSSCCRHLEIVFVVCETVTVLLVIMFDIVSNHNRVNEAITPFVRCNCICTDI